MMKLRKEKIEQTDFRELPKRSDIIYDKTTPKLELLIGQKNTNYIREASRAQWHKRHEKVGHEVDDEKKRRIAAADVWKQQKKEKEMADEEEQRKKGLNQSFREIPVDEKILETLKTKSMGRMRVDRPEQGKTKLDVIRDKAKVDIPTYFSSKFKFMAAAKKKESFIEETLPEVAFIGRSNVGKSSLINAVTQRGVAKTSDKPGLTQSINWYVLGSTMYLVDLPGYGFAFAKSDKVDQWNQLSLEYLLNRKSLKRVFILLDSRHGFKDIDRELLLELDKGRVKSQKKKTKEGEEVEEKKQRKSKMTKELVRSKKTIKVAPSINKYLKNLCGFSFGPAALN
eukprot:gene18227-21806_t